MKLTLGFIIFIVVVCINTIYGYPAVDNDEAVNSYLDSFGDNLQSYNFETENVRPKRVTCDIVRGLFDVGNAVCAVHCIGRRFRGGYCDKRSVCRCRK